ncbi:MAG: 50S ribosomal protein L6 [Candidatus Gracilibacteria bacterium]|jgi:large subunit ribosomal protein L6
MSRIGKKPVVIPTGVTVTEQSDGTLVVKGPKGELSFKPNPLIKVEVKENELIVVADQSDKIQHSLHGLTRTLLANMVEGVTKAFMKTMEINGVGYRVAVQGSKLVLNLGYSHPIEYPTPAGITFKVDDEKKNILYISGIDKQLVGQVAAEIREFRKPEPYKGKGIKYSDEHIRRKAGKAASKASA